MSIFGKRWEPDGRDALSTKGRLGLSIAVTGAMAFVLEYLGTQVFEVYAYTSPATFYIVIAVFGLALGPLLVLLRKTHIVVPMIMVGTSMVVAELFNHHFFIRWELVDGVFQDTGLLTSERIWEWRGGQLFGIEHPVLRAIVAGAVESLLVPVSVWTQKIVTLRYRKPSKVPLEEIEELFTGSVSPLEKFKIRRGFPFVFLRGLSLAFIIYVAYLIVGLAVRAWDLPLIGMNTLNPPATINTFGKLIIMISLASLAAFNTQIRKSALTLLVVAHIFAVGSSLGFYFGYSPNPLFPGDHQFLLMSGIVDGAVFVVLIILFLTTRSEDQQRGESIDLQSFPSVLLKNLLLGFGIVYSIFIAGALLSRILAEPDSLLGAIFGGPDPLVINIVTKYGTLMALSFMLYANPSRRKYFLPTLTLALMVSVAATMIYGLRGSTVITTQTGSLVIVPWFMMLQVLVDGGGLLAVWAVMNLQYHVEYQISTLRPRSAECVMVLHESLRESDPVPSVSTREVLQRIDEQIVGIRGRRRGLLGFPFWIVEHVFSIVTGLHPPFSLMSRAERRWMMRRHILRPGHERAKSLIPELSDFVYKIGDAVHALVTLAFYTTRRAHSQVGYVTPDARERLQPDISSERPPERVAPQSLPKDLHDPLGKKPASPHASTSRLLAPGIAVPRNEYDPPDEVDYCIVGSGAAGGVIAHRLAAANGPSVCVVERGGFYSPRQDFTDDEMRMIRLLYTEGGLQMTRSFDFTIAQGECVGGTTVINNAICLKMPDVSRKEWTTFGFDLDRLEDHYELVKKEINIDTLQDEAVNYRVENLFRKGVEAYNVSPNGMGPLSPATRLEGNFSNCLGCGLCNIGCKYMRKLSVLETYIPWARSNGARVVSNVGAVRCETVNSGARKKIISLIVRLPDGQFRKIRIRKALIVAAGAIASSRFLMRSELGGAGVGRGLSCNYAFPASVEFSDVINAFDGLQITMSAARESYEAIFETYFNPPGAYSISLATYFDQHAAMMNAYRRSVNFGILVGSDPSGSVSRTRDVMFGRAIEWNQTEEELDRIKRALVTVVRIAKGAGARRIILPTNPALSIQLESDFEPKLSQLVTTLNDKGFFNFFTAHPQGGNMMAATSFDERVAELDFRVRDCENLYVCDASVFPRSIRVNPQWTIMALASLAAESIA